MNKNNTEKRIYEFVVELEKLNPIDLYGLSKILGVEIEDQEPKEIVSEIITSYFRKSRSQRRKIDKLIKAAIKGYN